MLCVVLGVVCCSFARYSFFLQCIVATSVVNGSLCLILCSYNICHCAVRENVQISLCNDKMLFMPVFKIEYFANNRKNDMHIMLIQQYLLFGI